MAGNTEEKVEAQVEQVPSDPWAMAFAALDQEEQEDAEGAVADKDMGSDNATLDKEGKISDTEDDDLGGRSPEAEVRDGADLKGQPGGPDNTGGEAGGEDDDLGWLGVELTEGEIEEQRKAFVEEIRQRAIEDVAREYVKQGARNVNGRLGATINDPDVCKRDRDGVPRFYNPETGREFTGDNPRRQAQEWVDDYNRELADAFNKTCAEYSQKLMEREGGRIAIIEFAPKYKALDPVRRSMFEAVIEDYEVTDKDGNIVAYSCDLDKALAAVNRQVRVIQQRYSKQQAQAPSAPSGPVLDTPSSGGTRQGEGKPQFKSLAEAMEWEQDQLLARKKGNR